MVVISVINQPATAARTLAFSAFGSRLPPRRATVPVGIRTVTSIHLPVTRVETTLLPLIIAAFRAIHSSKLNLDSSNPLLRHDHRAHDGHQQQQRRNLKRQHVIAVQPDTNLLRVVALKSAITLVKRRRKHAATRAINKRQQSPERQGGNRGHDPLLVELVLADVLLQVDQHDDEQEQHHDSAGVEHDLHRSHKGRVQHQIKASQREQSHDQRQRRVHRVAPRDHRNGGHDSSDRQKVEKERCRDRIHIVCFSLIVDLTSVILSGGALLSRAGVQGPYYETLCPPFVIPGESRDLPKRQLYQTDN